MITIKERDKKLEELWAELDDVPFNPETEESEAEYQHFPVGTHKFEIWKWFDERYSKGVASLIYQNSNADTITTERLYYLNKLTFPCRHEDCVYNASGNCRFALINEVCPETSTTGCKDYYSKIPTKSWVWNEAPFRLEEVLQVPKEKLTAEVINGVRYALYDSDESLFDYEKIDNVIEEKLSQYNIAVGDNCE